MGGWSRGGQGTGDGVDVGEQAGQNGGHRAPVRRRAMPQDPRLVDPRGQRSQRWLLGRRGTDSGDHGGGHSAGRVVRAFAD